MPFPKMWTVQGLAEQYASGELTPVAVVEEIIRRAEADAAMNIWIVPPSLELIQPYLDGLREMDRNASPLWGIPFAIKDNIDLAGVPTTAACPEYSYVPSEHAAVVERLIRAGAIPIGKTNLDQFATGLVGTRSPHGETHNALRPELISGGSSSGSAAAVARGQAAFSLGTDTAGSGRVPAALNRLVGYKPSLGAWPTKGVVPACASLDCVTVFAATLADTLAVDAVARGPHAEDPWSRVIPAPTAKLPRRICLPDTAPDFYGPYAEEYRSAWEQAVQRLKSLGLPVEYVDTTFFAAAAAILYEGPWVAERWAALGGFVESRPGVTFPVTERILRSGAASEHSAVSVFRAMHQLQAYKLEARKLLDGDAVLVMPTAGGTWTREQVRLDPIATNRDMGRYTNHCNLLDLSAVAVPGEDADVDLPFGITFFALAEGEGLLAGVADKFLMMAEPLTYAVQHDGSLNGHALGAEHSGVGVSSLASTPTTGSALAVLPSATVSQSGESVSAEETTLVAVCGLHMRGFPLEKQMNECGARFIKEAATAPKYKLLKLNTTPVKPGLVKQVEGGASIQLEVWEMPKSAFGGFTAGIPAPLGIGKVELTDGTEVPGFICEGYAEQEAEDVTELGSWRKVMLQS
ncbi:allophanate hydrolase [Paenibacillus sp. GCM10023252]|uniref:allophanate hydrolase n=1 Tax=Paenibacillus sp. GCM10023252 TaxID=3252649 RepID=UPI00361AFEE0